MQRNDFVVRGRPTKLQNYKHSYETSKNSFSVKIIVFEMMMSTKIFLWEVALQIYKIGIIPAKLQKLVSVSIISIFELIMQKIFSCERSLYKMKKKNTKFASKLKKPVSVSILLCLNR